MTLHDRLLHDLVKVPHLSNNAIWVTHHRKEADRAGTQLLRIHDGVVSPELTEHSQWHVQVVSAADTFGLRRLVLRDDTRTTDVNFDGDETAIHLEVSDPAGREIIASLASHGIVNIDHQRFTTSRDGKPSELSRARCSTGPSAVRYRVGSESVR